MAFTAAFLLEVETAIQKLAKGERKVSLSVGDKTITYAQTDMESLLDLKQRVLDEVQTEAVRPRFVLISTEKGL